MEIIFRNNDKRKNEVSLVDKIHLYNLTCFYGCGRYPIVPDYNSYVKIVLMLLKLEIIPKITDGQELISASIIGKMERYTSIPLIVL